MENYEIIENLGKGAFSSVEKALNIKNGKYYSIKILDKKYNKLAEKEIENLEKLKDVCNPYLLCFENVFITDDVYYIVTEYLYGYVTIKKFFDEYDARDTYIYDDDDNETIIQKDEDYIITHIEYNILFDNLCKGLKFLHENDIVHRDIKHQNILMDRRTLNIKYIDFGLSENSSNFTNSTRGTVSFMAPERNFPTFESLKKADLWSLGILLYYIIFEQTPLQYFIDEFEYKEKFFGDRRVNFQKILTDPKKDEIITRMYFKYFDYFIDQDMYEEDEECREDQVESFMKELNKLRKNKISLLNLLSRDPEKRDYYC